jgi:hypothetical protein
MTVLVALEPILFPKTVQAERVPVVSVGAVVDGVET